VIGGNSLHRKVIEIRARLLQMVPSDRPYPITFTFALPLEYLPIRPVYSQICIVITKKRHFPEARKVI